jgi:Sap, sulfolipid-1-addressing protein
MAVTVLELPTALPYLGAAGAITRAGLPIAEWLPLLVVYNLIFVLLPLVLLAGHLALGKRAEAVLGRLRDRLGRAARGDCCGCSAWSGSSCSRTPSATSGHVIVRPALHASWLPVTGKAGATA